MSQGYDKQACLFEPEIPLATEPPPSHAIHHTKGVHQMGKSIEELLKQRADLDAEIEKARNEARAGAFAEISRILQNAGISVAELHAQYPLRSNGGTAKPAREKAVVKYRDPKNPNNLWSGRGRKASWLQKALDNGAKIEEFLA